MKERIRGQDVIVAAVLFSSPFATHTSLAQAIGIQRSHFSESTSRLVAWRLYSSRRKVVSGPRFHEFLQSAFSWLFPVAVQDGVVRGVPVSHAGPVLQARMLATQPYVWPIGEESVPVDVPVVMGRAVKPIHRKVVAAALQFPRAYTILSLAEALRVGRAREINLAREALKEILVHA